MTPTWPPLLSSNTTFPRLGFPRQLGISTQAGVLQAVAAELQQDTRADDLVGRLGGEEFAVLLPSTNPADAAEIAERIRRRIAGLRVTVHSKRDQSAVIDNLTCSVGVATLPDAADTLQLLAKAADEAQYAAKDAGRNQIVIAPTLVRRNSDMAPAVNLALYRRNRFFAAT